jgi:integrase
MPCRSGTRRFYFTVAKQQALLLDLNLEPTPKAFGAALPIPRITHHDLRHLFATRCIESGMDIPTVAHWLGHSDGGALAMKVYGHLRREHSASMAQKVTFQTA